MAQERDFCSHFRSGDPKIGRPSYCRQCSLCALRCFCEVCAGTPCANVVSMRSKVVIQTVRQVNVRRKSGGDRRFVLIKRFYPPWITGTCPVRHFLTQTLTYDSSRHRLSGEDRKLLHFLQSFVAYQRGFPSSFTVTMIVKLESLQVDGTCFKLQLLLTQLRTAAVSS